MLEKIKNDPLMKEYEIYLEKERKQIRDEINQLRVNTNIQINVLNIRLKKLSQDRNRMASLLYKNITSRRVSQIGIRTMSATNSLVSERRT